MSYSRPILVLFFLLGLFTRLMAQSPDTFHLDLFEYSESYQRDLPGHKKENVDSQTLDQYDNQNLADLLSNHTPVHIKSYGLGGLSTPTFRGTGPSHTQIAWNGVPVNSPMNGLVDLTLFPANLVDGLSIGYGNAVLTNRPGGLGGRINMTNRPKWNQPFHTSLTQHIGSFGNYQTFSEIGLGGDSWQSQSHFYYRTAENDYSYPNLAKAGNPTEKEDNAAFNQWGIMEEFYGKISEKDFISAHGWFQKTNRELPNPVNVTDKAQTQEDQQLRSSLKWRHYWKGGRLKAQTAFLDQKIHYNDSVAGINARHRSKSSLNEFNIRQKLFENGTLSSGLRFDYHWARSNGYSGMKDQMKTAIYSQYTHRFSQTLQGNLGLQQAFIDGERAPFIPSIGVTYKPFTKNRFFIRGGLSRNYKVPSLNDLYWEKGGNPSLDPEKGWSEEIGLGYNHEKVTQWFKQIKLDLTGFRGLYDNWIMWTPNNSGIWEAKNIEKVLTRGIEANLLGRFKWKTLKFGFNGHYGFTQTKNLKGTQNLDASKGKQLIYVPFHQANANFSVSFKGYRLFYHHHYTGKRFVARDHSKWLNGYQIANSGLSKDFHLGRFEVSGQFRVENLWDVYYEEMAWRPMPGRSFHLKIQLKYAEKSK